MAPPEYDQAEFEIDPGDFRYELLLSDKGKEGKYKLVYGYVYLYLQLFVGLVSYLRYLCIVVSNTYNVLCFCFVLLRLVYPMLPISLDCPFLIAPSVFCTFFFTYRRLFIDFLNTPIIMPNLRFLASRIKHYKTDLFRNYVCILKLAANFLYAFAASLLDILFNPCLSKHMYVCPPFGCLLLFLHFIGHSTKTMKISIQGIEINSQ